MHTHYISQLKVDLGSLDGVSKLLTIEYETSIADARFDRLADYPDKAKSHMEFSANAAWTRLFALSAPSSIIITHRHFNGLKRYPQQRTRAVLILFQWKKLMMLSIGGTSIVPPTRVRTLSGKICQ
jgi:hypothetical protein